jgi:hypothetical protein
VSRPPPPPTSDPSQQSPSLKNDAEQRNSDAQQGKSDRNENETYYIFIFIINNLNKQNSMRKNISMKRAQSRGHSGFAKVMTIVALLLFVSTGAWAQGPWTSGDCTVTLSGGVLTVSKTSGTGAMADYANAGAQPWSGSRTSITSIVVGEGVTHIGNSAFRGCSNATSISLPTSLTSIGNSAFNGCTNEALTSITIPENVESIGQQAFMNCPGLTSVTIGNSVTSIGNGAFTSCNNEGFTTVDIPNSVETIGQNAFLSCTGLTTVTLGSGVTSIGSSAFANCSNLTTVTLNSNPTIDTYAFSATTAVTMNLTANAAGGAYWMTFYNQNYGFEADANTQVFKAALTDTELELTELTTDQIVKANNAVILKSTTSPIVMTLTSTASSNDFSGNSLLGVSAAAGLTAADPSTTFVLNNDTQGVGFYKLASGSTVGVGNAYLTYDGNGDFFGLPASESSVDPVEEVIGAINALPVAADVTTADYAAIIAARAAYDALTAEQKENVPAELLAKLEADEEVMVFTVSLKEGTEDADKWTIAPAEATTTGVAKGTEITATYSGNRHVKGVKAVKKAAAPAEGETYTNLQGGEVLHVGDKITETDGKFRSTHNENPPLIDYNTYIRGSKTYEVLRADVALVDYHYEYTESPNGQYYVLKCTYFDSDDTGEWVTQYHFIQNLPVTGTSDGITVTLDGQDDYQQNLYTFWVHEPNP